MNLRKQIDKAYEACEKYLDQMNEAKTKKELEVAYKKWQNANARLDELCKQRCM